jgi:O-succinylbenzoate synthase
MITSFARYRLPLRAPLITARSTLHHRDGVLVRDEQGRLGDACPLPGWSRETVDQVVGHLDGSTDGEWPPSLSFAAATRATFPMFAPTVAITTFIDDARQAAVVTNPRTTIKLKVGTHGHDVDVAAIKGLRARVPGLQLRLDGNRQLTIAHTHALAELAGVALQWFEEPVPLSSLAMLDASIPLAADECFFLHGDDSHFVEMMRDRAIAWVLKPMMMEMIHTKRWQQQALLLNKHVVISSVFESAVGRSALLNLAADHPTMAHGLDTGRYLANDITDVFCTLSWQAVV